MRDEIRWAARYQFLDELWRGKDRMIVDAAVERALRFDRAALGPGVDARVALLDALLPRDRQGRQGDVWFVTASAARVAEFSRQRPGAACVALDDATNVAEGDWEVALINLEGVHTQGDLAALSPAMSALLEVVSEVVEEDGRRCAIMLPGPAAGGPDESAAVHMLGSILPRARLFALLWPTVASFVSMGSLGDEDGDDAFAVDVDNSVAPEVLEVDTWIAVVSPDFRPATMTMVELDPGADAATDAGTGAQDDRVAELKAQLQEARRRADLLAIERQQALEQIEELNERLSDREDEDGRGVTGPAGGEVAAQWAATEQALEWEIQRLRAQVEALTLRPIDALEADNAALRARLAALEGRAGAGDGGDGQDGGDDSPGDDGEGHDDPVPRAPGGAPRDGSADEPDDEPDDGGREDEDGFDHSPGDEPSPVQPDEGSQDAGRTPPPERAGLEPRGSPAAGDPRDLLTHGGTAQAEVEAPATLRAGLGGDPDRDAAVGTGEPPVGDPAGSAESVRDATRGARWNDDADDEDEPGFERLRRGLLSTLDKLIRRLDG